MPVGLFLAGVSQSVEAGHNREMDAGFWVLAGGEEGVEEGEGEGHQEGHMEASPSMPFVERGQRHKEAT